MAMDSVGYHNTYKSLDKVNKDCLFAVIFRSNKKNCACTKLNVDG